MASPFLHKKNTLWSFIQLIRSASGARPIAEKQK